MNTTPTTPPQPWATACGFHRLVPIGEVRPSPKNVKEHPAAQLEVYREIIRKQGWRRPIVVSNRSGTIVSGHGALAAAKLDGQLVVPVEFQDFESDESEDAARIADNRLAELGSNNAAALAGILSGLATGPALSLTGYSSSDVSALMANLSKAGTRSARLSLSLPFGIPAVSVLDARKDYWRKRREAWRDLGCPEGGIDPVLVETLIRWYAPPAPKVSVPADPVFRFVVVNLGGSTADQGCDLVIGTESVSVGGLANDRFAVLIGTPTALPLPVHDSATLIRDASPARAFASNRKLGAGHLCITILRKGHPLVESWPIRTDIP